MPHPSQPATAEPADPPPAKKPRGNPNLHLAPEQPARGLDPRGARTRSGCPCRSPAIHGKLRCRMHGGRSTGPRTPKSLPRRRPGSSSWRKKANSTFWRKAATASPRSGPCGGAS